MASPSILEPKGLGGGTVMTRSPVSAIIATHARAYGISNAISRLDRANPDQ